MKFGFFNLAEIVFNNNILQCFPDIGRCIAYTCQFLLYGSYRLSAEKVAVDFQVFDMPVLNIEAKINLANRKPMSPLNIESGRLPEVPIPVSIFFVSQIKHFPPFIFRQTIRFEFVTILVQPVEQMLPELRYTHRLFKKLHNISNSASNRLMSFRCDFAHFNSECIYHFFQITVKQKGSVTKHPSDRRKLGIARYFSATCQNIISSAHLCRHTQLIQNPNDRFIEFEEVV